MTTSLDHLAELLSDKESPPNTFSRQLGTKIKAAREEANISQYALARRVFRRRATISQTELGNSGVQLSTLALIAHALGKPLVHFLPTEAQELMQPDGLDSEESDLVLQFRRVKDERLRQIAILQIKALADFFESSSDTP